MANTVLERAIPKEDPRQAGWAAPAPQTQTQPGGGDVRGPIARTDAMTIGGVTSATTVLFIILMATATYGWSLVDPAPQGQLEIPVWTWFVAIGGALLAMVAIFKPPLARFIGPVYAAAQGVFLGAISRAFENQWDGIVVQAVLITAIVFGSMLFLFATRLVRVTDRMRRTIIYATLGLALFYFVSILISLFGLSMPLIWDAGPVGILFSVGVCGLAAFNLMLDFDLVDRGVGAGLPKYMEWYCALGLMISLVWLYLEVLRLLSKLRQ